MMDCQECQQHLLDYAYGELPPQLEEEFESALEGCPSCQQELARLRALRTSVREVLPIEEPPALVRANILREARKQIYAEQEAADDTIWAWLHSILFHPSFAMAAAVLLVIGVTLVLQRDGALDEPNIPEAVSSNLEEPAKEAMKAEEAPAPAATEGVADNAGVRNVGLPGGVNDQLAEDLPEGESADPATPADDAVAEVAEDDADVVADAPKVAAPSKAKRDANDDTLAAAQPTARNDKDAEGGEVWNAKAATGKGRALDDGVVADARVDRGSADEGRSEVARAKSAATRKTSVKASAPPTPRVDSARTPANMYDDADERAARRGATERQEEAKRAEAETRRDAEQERAVTRRQVQEERLKKEPAQDAKAEAVVEEPNLGITGSPTRSRATPSSASVDGAEGDLWNSNGSLGGGLSNPSGTYGVRGAYDGDGTLQQMESKDLDKAEEEPSEESAGDEKEQRRKFEEGMSRYNNGDYRSAVEGFDEFINEAPRTSNYYALALFQRGMSESKMGDHRKASQTFRQVLAQYPRSEKASEARYHLALSLLKLDPNSAEAERILNNLARGGGAYSSRAREEHDRAFGRKDNKKDAKPAPSRRNKKQQRATPYDFEEADQYQAPAESPE